MRVTGGCAAALLAVLVVGCGEDPMEPPRVTTPPEATGSGEAVGGPSRLAVNVATDGVALDPDGYTLVLDGDSVAAVDVNALVELWIAPGTHRLELGSVAPNCSTTGTVSFTAEPNARREVPLRASCVAPGELPAMRILLRDSSGLVSMNADGTDRVTVLADSMIETPDVTSDGKRIAYARKESGRYALWVADADGANGIRLVSGAYGPSWSPDGARIAYTGFEGVQVIPADGSTSRLLLAGDLFGDWTFYFTPTWSPDGTRVAVAWWTFDGTSRGVLLVGLHGELSPVADSGVAGDSGLAWSVDDRIAYAASDGAIKTIRPDGTGETTILAGREGAAPRPRDWSPGGAWLLYTDRNPSGGTDLFLLSPADGLPIRVTGSGDVGTAVFLPDVVETMP